MVASAELPADLGQGEVGELAAQVHGDVAGRDHGARAVGRAQVVDGDAEVVGGLRHDEGGRDLLALGVGDDVLEDHLGQGLVDGLLVEGGEGRHPDECALELADVGGDARGDVLQDVEGQVEALSSALAGEDRDAGLQVRGLDVGQQTPLEPGAQALIEPAQGLGRLVGGEDYLLARGVQGVEGMEELLEGRFFALEELDIIDQKNVDLTVAALESFHAAVVLVAVAYAGDEVGDEDLGVDVLDADSRVERLGVVADGVQQVGLAQSGAAVDEQGVVGTGRGLGHRQGSGVGEPVGGTGDVGVEGVARVELGDVVGRRRREQPRGVLGAGGSGAEGAGES